jgi:L-fuconate dehydratase
LESTSQFQPWSPSRSSRTTSAAPAAGLACTLGEGNELVCKAAGFHASSLQGRDIGEIVANFGARQKEMADDFRM